MRVATRDKTMSQVQTSWVEITAADGRRFGAWLARPPKTPEDTPAPGVVVLQEIWGVNAHIRAVAEQYASDGYVAIAPDVFWRMQPRVNLDYNEADNKKAFAFRHGLDLDLADQDVAATVAMLKTLQGVNGRTAAVGYCMGGMLAYRAAAKAGIDCAVCYYGGGIHQQLDLASSIDVPLAFHFGDKDQHITPDAVDAVKKTFAGRDNVRIDIYAGADHGFNCWGRPSYHQNAAALAHGRSLAFLATHLD